jgi:hypothetical protein
VSNNDRTRWWELIRAPKPPEGHQVWCGQHWHDKRSEALACQAKREGK